MSSVESPEDTPFTAAAPSRANPDLTRRLARRAVIELLLQGQRPTVQKVRARTRRGSTGTINEILREILVEAGHKLSDDNATGAWQKGLPPAFIAAVLRAWEIASEEARKPYEERLAALSSKEEAGAAAVATRLADEARDRLAHEAAGLSKQVLQLQDQVEQLKATASSFERRRQRHPQSAKTRKKKRAVRPRRAARLSRANKKKSPMRSSRTTRRVGARRRRKRR